MAILPYIIRVSRPRFWVYLAGTYWTGVAAGVAAGITDINSYTNYWIYILLLFFLIPANIFLYGINDYFDQDTDAINTKKGDKEVKISEYYKTVLKPILIISGLISLLLIVSAPSVVIAILLSLFFFLSVFYSAPPLRFKQYPFIDFLSNSLYIIPGIIGYTLVTNTLPSLVSIGVLCCWAFSMHLFSAIVDIIPDKKAGIHTTAVVLGKQTSLVLCCIFWFIFAFVPLIYRIGFPFNILLFIYPIIPLYMVFKEANIHRVYWWFPWINAGIGLLIYLYFTIHFLNTSFI